jgi:hypothetical protein
MSINATRWHPRWRAVARLGIAIGVLAGSTVAGHAQIGYLWTFGELTEKADCVVIGEHVRTRDTGRRTTHPELTPGYPVIELQTDLRPLAVLKSSGQAECSSVTRIRLRHYRPDDERIQGGLLNGGTALALTPNAAYLMFLRRADGGVYEPLSGQAFPTLSAYRVPRPFE